MVKKSVRETLYFIVMALLFYIAAQIVKALSSKMSIAVVAALYTVVMAGIFFFGKVNSNKENFWDISPAAKCKGGNWYNWQGDDPTSKMCRQLANTKEGQDAIASYSCPSGYEGIPKIPFQYTPLSNDNWKNERCG